MTDPKNPQNGVVSDLSRAMFGDGYVDAVNTNIHKKATDAAVKERQQAVVTKVTTIATLILMLCLVAIAVAGTVLFILWMFQ